MLAEKKKSPFSFFCVGPTFSLSQISIYKNASINKESFNRFEEFKKHDQNDCQPHVFLTLPNTLKTKVGDVVGCIFEVECSGFLILKQIIVYFLTKKPQHRNLHPK
jgi:hypothetical protein